MAKTVKKILHILLIFSLGLSISPTLLAEPPSEEDRPDLVVSPDEANRLEVLQYDQVPFDDQSGIRELLESKKNAGVKKILVPVERGLEHKAETFVQIAREMGFEVDVQLESPEAAQYRHDLFQRLRGFWGQVYHPPSEEDRLMIRVITIGTGVAATAGALVGWDLLDSDFSPLRAGGYVAAQVFAAYVMTAWFETVNNLLGRRAVGELEARSNPLNETFFRSAITTGWIALFRSISGEIGYAQPIYTLPGFFEVLSLGAVAGVTSARFATWANRIPTPEERRYANLFWFSLTYPLVLMEQSGLYMFRVFEMAWPLDHSWFKVTGSMLLLVAISTSIVGWVKKRPESFRTFLNTAHGLLSGSKETRQAMIEKIRCKAHIANMSPLSLRRRR